MDKLYVCRITKSGEPNKNQVVYSEDLFQKCMKNVFNTLGFVPITRYTNKLDLLPSVRPEDVLGKLVDLNDIKPDGIEILPSDNEKYEIIKEMIDHGYKIGPRYISKNPLMSTDGMMRLTNMKIVSLDLTPSSNYKLT